MSRQISLASIELTCFGMWFQFRKHYLDLLLHHFNGIFAEHDTFKFLIVVRTGIDAGFHVEAGAYLKGGVRNAGSSTWSNGWLHETIHPPRIHLNWLNVDEKDASINDGYTNNCSNSKVLVESCFSNADWIIEMQISKSLEALWKGEACCEPEECTSEKFDETSNHV